MSLVVFQSLSPAFCAIRGIHPEIYNNTEIEDELRVDSAHQLVLHHLWWIVSQEVHYFRYETLTSDDAQSQHVTNRWVRTIGSALTVITNLQVVLETVPHRCRLLPVFVLPLTACHRDDPTFFISINS